jgi:heme A synthase
MTSGKRFPPSERHLVVTRQQAGTLFSTTSITFKLIHLFFEYLKFVLLILLSIKTHKTMKKPHCMSAMGFRLSSGGQATWGQVSVTHIGLALTALPVHEIGAVFRVKQSGFFWGDFLLKLEPL